MFDPLHIIALFFASLLASIVGSMVGGGGLVTIPLMILFGLPPQVAIGTNKLGALGTAIGAIPRYTRAKKIVWPYIIPFCLLAFAGSYAGTWVLLEVPNNLLQPIIGIFILLLLPVLFLNKDIGEERIAVSPSRRFFGYISYFLLVSWQSFFGGGAATVAIYILMFFFGLTMIESSATHRIPTVCLTVLSLIILGSHGLINWTYGTAIFFGMVIGGYIGARIAILKGNAWVKWIFATVASMLGIYMILQWFK